MKKDMSKLLVTLITIGCFLQAQVLFAQPLVVWDTLLGEKGVDEAVDIVQNYDGRIGILAKTSTTSWSDDFWFLLMETDGRIVRSRAFGSVFKDEPRKIIAGGDGSYWLIGEIERSTGLGDGKTYVNPMIIRVSESGEKELLSVVFINADFTVRDALESTTGSLYLLLESAGQSFYYEFSLGRDRMLAPLAIPSNGSDRFEKLIRAGDRYLIVGNDVSGALVFRSFDPRISALSTQMKLHPDHPVIRIGDVRMMSDSIVRMAATLKVPRESNNMGLLTVNLRSGSISTEHYGGRLEDGANTFEILHDGSEWLGGYSLSNRESRSRVSDGLLITKDPQGQEGMYFLGGTGTDEIRKLLQLREEGLVMLQTTGSSPARRKDIRITRYQTPPVSLEEPAAKLLARQLRLMDANENDRLEVGEFAWLEIELENPSDKGHSAGEWQLALMGGKPGITVPETIRPGYFGPGQLRTVRIPVRVALVRESQTVPLQISGPSLADVLHYPLTIEGTAGAQLAFGTMDVRLADSASHENPCLILAVEVINKGTLASGPLELIIDHPSGLQSEEGNIHLAAVDTGVARRIEKVLIAENLTADSLMRFMAVLYDGQDSLLLRKVVSVDVRQLLEPLRQMPAIAQLQSRDGLVPLEETKTISRDDLVIPRIETEPETTREPVLYIVWNDPSPLKDYDQYKEYGLATYPLRLAVITEEALEREEVTCNLYLNHMLYATQSGDGKLSGGEQVSFYQYWYEEEIRLEEGENRIHLEIVNEDGVAFRSDPMVISYTPPRSNAHVYAFGIPHDDLPLVSKDAADFVRLFENQHNLLFSQVHTHLFNTRENTSIESLRKALINLENDYWKFERIRENDVIFIYFSTHGFTYGLNNEEFRLASSDFDRRYERLYSLDFKKDLLDVLKPMRCKVVLLMDACYSGQIAYINAPVGVKGMSDSFDLELSRAITRIAEAENDLYFLLSCEPEEKSYADASWDNSAFTKALVEYLDPESAGMPLLPDPYSDDPIITLGELFAWLSERVPAIVRTKKDIDTQQHPMLVNGAKVLEMPVYVRKNERR
jgi:hypothetical protein